MSKFLTLLTTAVLVLLLVAFGLFLVRDKPVPTPVVKDPAYEAAALSRAGDWVRLLGDLAYAGQPSPVQGQGSSR